MPRIHEDLRRLVSYGRLLDGIRPGTDRRLGHRLRPGVGRRVRGLGGSHSRVVESWPDVAGSDPERFIRHGAAGSGHALGRLRGERLRLLRRSGEARRRRAGEELELLRELAHVGDDPVALRPDAIDVDV
jgi:hypothetical protein